MKGIYILIFPNGKKYIGRSTDIKKRIRTHRNQLKTNTHKNQLLQNVYNKHGEFQYELLELCESTEHGEKEKFWISNLSPELNLTKGGDGGELLTEEEKERRRNIIYTEEYKQKMSLIMLSLNITKEKLRQRGQKISDSRKKLYNDPIKKQWLIEHSGIHNSQGYKNQKKGSNSPIAKKVINIETGEIYGSLKETAEKTNMIYTTLLANINEYKHTNKTPYRYL
jgi:group I intron endonuclease